MQYADANIARDVCTVTSQRHHIIYCIDSTYILQTHKHTASVSSTTLASCTSTLHCTHSGCYAAMYANCRCLAKASAIAPEAPRTLTTTALMLTMSLLQSTEPPQCAQQLAQAQREPSERKLLQFARSCCAAQTQLQQLCSTAASSGGWCDAVDAGVVHEVCALNIRSALPVMYASSLY
jgi:hypothetical protein